MWNKNHLLAAHTPSTSAHVCVFPSFYFNFFCFVLQLECTFTVQKQQLPSPQTSCFQRIQFFFDFNMREHAAVLCILLHATLNYQHEVIKISNQNAVSHPKCNSIQLGSQQRNFVASQCMVKRHSNACGVAGW